MIVVIGSVVAAPGRVDDALALSLAHVQRSRAEPGCLSHAVHRDAENPQRLVFVEEWAGMAALQQHFQVPASRAFAKALSTMATEPPAMTLYEAAPVSIPRA
ncbi:MAG TPA: putative quinol monooxygenase [Ideonella sp.]|uniref:putative quinol monooxygenase n=1 Tax=Ideonella sp. TaxID=1929293 RepID=UPI002E37EF20|nr:putative quinol monooxygenase [Ideonella sp.]HEX5686225.1 putative quinol monooxygenase [Ideonella sp.]